MELGHCRNIHLCFVKDEASQVFRELGRVRDLGEVRRVANQFELSFGQRVRATIVGDRRRLFRRLDVERNVVEKKRRLEILLHEDALRRWDRARLLAHGRRLAERHIAGKEKKSYSEEAKKSVGTIFPPHFLRFIIRVLFLVDQIQL